MRDWWIEQRRCGQPDGHRSTGSTGLMRDLCSFGGAVLVCSSAASPQEVRVATYCAQVQRVLRGTKRV